MAIAAARPRVAKAAAAIDGLIAYCMVTVGVCPGKDCLQGKMRSSERAARLEKIASHKLRGLSLSFPLHPRAGRK